MFAASDRKQAGLICSLDRPRFERAPAARCNQGTGFPERQHPALDLARTQFEQQKRYEHESYGRSRPRSDPLGALPGPGMVAAAACDPGIPKHQIHPGNDDGFSDEW
jgi:hypothetical protein